MAGGAAPNPYGANVPDYAGQYGNAADYGQPSQAYAAPGPDANAPYNDEFGWGPSPKIGVENTPDAMRLGSYPTRTMRPNGGDAPQRYYGPQDADHSSRHSVEDVDANGWKEQKDRYKIGPDPRWNPPVETRATSDMAPRSYSFVRPWDQGTKGNGAREFNGTHFSFADHRRDYEILGIKPWSQHRNTYRVDPAPWDADMYDVPPPESIGTTSYGRVQSVDLPENPSRSFRL